MGKDMKNNTMLDNIKKEPFLTLLLAFLLISFLFASLGYFLGRRDTIKENNNTECKKCEVCEKDDDKDDDTNDLISLPQLGVINESNKNLVGTRYVYSLYEVADNVGLLIDSNTDEKEIIFRNYAISETAIIDLSLKSQIEMGLITRDEFDNTFNLTDEDEMMQCIKLSKDTFNSYFKVIFGESNLNEASKHLPHWKFIDGYYYYSDIRTSSLKTSNFAVFKSVELTSTGAEIYYMYGQFDASSGDYTCRDGIITNKDIQDLGLKDENERNIIALCGRLKKLTLKKNDDGTYYMYKLDNVN